MTENGSPISGEPSPKIPIQNGRLSRSSVLFLGMLIMCAIVPVSRWLLFDIDHQYANLTAAFLLFVAFLLGYAGIFFSKVTIRAVKWGLLILPFVALGICFLLFEFVGFTGETLPVFRLRSDSRSAQPRIDLGSSANSAQQLSLSPELEQSRSTQFLGSNRDGIIAAPSFNVDWETRLPSVLWRRPIGAGWSSFAVDQGLAVTFEQIDEHECLSAYELQTGRLVWQVKLLGKHFQALGGLGPRSTPTIHNGRVYAQSAIGVVACVKLENGSIVWKKNLLELTNIDQSESEKAIMWGRSGSPLVVENQLILPLGGKAGDPSLKTLVSLNLQDGAVLWTGGNTQIAYASPMLASIHGVPQIVSVNEGNATGHDPKDGHMLWTTPWPSKSNGDACASQPVLLNNDRVLLGKGYAQGSKVIELSYDKDAPLASQWKAGNVWENSRVLKTKFTSSIFYQGKLYGLSDGILECVDPKNGVRIWRGKRYGQGQLLVVNHRLLVLSEDGQIALIAANSDDAVSAGTEIVSMQVLHGITWNVPAVAGKYLLVRNAEEAVCLISTKE